jgi:DNA invertase Pin-like site-specific DNA recombinase
MPANNRPAIRMHVTTADQKPDLRLDDLHAYAEGAGLELARQYLDVAMSRRKHGRPQLDALMQTTRVNAFDCVLVWKLHRFARSTKHRLRAPEEFDLLGIRLVSNPDRTDTGSPIGKAVCAYIGATAKLESSLFSERSRPA